MLNKSNYFYILPAILILSITSLYPVIYGLIISLYDWNWGSEKVFTGLTNYTELIVSEEFWGALANTFKFSISTCLIEVSLGFFIAVQVQKIKINTTIIQALLMIPLMMSGIVVALFSKTMLDPFSGVYNYFLVNIGIQPSAFFGSPESAMQSVILVDIWWQTAFVFIIALAGLQSIPQEPINAARLEGASNLQIFWKIKAPILKPLILTVILIRAVDTLKVFDIIFGATGGGPGNATEVIQTLTYRTAYGYLQIGKAMSIMVLFSLIIIFIILFFNIIKRKNNAYINNK